MNKLCITCQDSVDELTHNLFSKDDKIIPDWFKKIGNYSILPPPINCNSRYNLYKKKNRSIVYPDSYDSKIKINSKNFSPRFKNKTWFFYWAARPRNYHKTEYQLPAKAYGGFKNCGISKVDNEGNIVFKFCNPYPYEENNIKYPPHLHFIYLNENGLWDETCNTMIVTPNLNLDIFNYALESEKYMVICAIHKEANLPIIDDTVRIAFDTPLEKINKMIHGKVSKKLVKKHQRVENIPYVIYGKNPECEASQHLVEKLRKLEYINLITFKGGIDKYYRKNH